MPTKVRLVKDMVFPVVMYGCANWTKKNAFESVLMRWMKLEPIIQSEVSQREKHQYSILTHIYGCESWTVKKAECQRVDAFELWC